MIVSEYKTVTTKQKPRSLYIIHKLDGYMCVFPEGITIDCDQGSAVGKSIANSHLEPDVGTQAGLKDPRQQSTKVEKLETVVSELSKT